RPLPRCAGRPVQAAGGGRAWGTGAPQQVLLDGDRIELLRPLQADPKDNRRRRARGG
ncbi:hypothetical protein C7E25_18760, partial [Stenotrophomonas maltophilia]